MQAMLTTVSPVLWPGLSQSGLSPRHGAPRCSCATHAQQGRAVRVHTAGMLEEARDARDAWHARSAPESSVCNA